MTIPIDHEVIAKGLTEAQRLACLWFAADGTERNWRIPYNDRPHQRSILALLDRGIVDGVTDLSGFVRGSLTPLGIQVRQFLTGESQ